jgi:NAD(P)-dependent dehydrogenase (short-subunit alcohol dehydrogenase family)
LIRGGPIALLARYGSGRSNFGVNVKGATFSVQTALTREGGSTILMGRQRARPEPVEFSVYYASKTAIRNLGRSWTLDLKAAGVRVHVLSPGEPFRVTENEAK